MTDLIARIQVRAYFLTLNEGLPALDAWLEAEGIERYIAEAVAEMDDIADTLGLDRETGERLVSKSPVLAMPYGKPAKPAASGPLRYRVMVGTLEISKHRVAAPALASARKVRKGGRLPQIVVLDENRTFTPDGFANCMSEGIYL